jgi:CBS domain-containing protein
LRSKELSQDGDLSMEQAMRPGPSTYRPHVLLKELVEKMVEHQVESSPITTSDGKLVGLLIRADAEQKLAKYEER